MHAAGRPQKWRLSAAAVMSVATGKGGEPPVAGHGVTVSGVAESRVVTERRHRSEELCRRQSHPPTSPHDTATGSVLIGRKAVHKKTAFYVCLPSALVYCEYS